VRRFSELFAPLFDTCLQAILELKRSILCLAFPLGGVPLRLQLSIQVDVSFVGKSGSLELLDLVFTILGKIRKPASIVYQRFICLICHLAYNFVVDRICRLKFDFMTIVPLGDIQTGHNWFYCVVG
jgi:hypothetical protein